MQAQVQIGMPYITVGSLQAGELVDKFNLENPDYVPPSTQYRIWLRLRSRLKQ